MEDGPGYTGHVQDAATGLVYMQQRYYAPELGRFLSVDPVTVDSSTGANFNRYWYANNNPYKYKDPDGHDAIYFTDTRTLVYPVYFKGVGATDALIAEIKQRVESLKTYDIRIEKIVLQVLDNPGGDGTNVMDLSPGKDYRYGEDGEGVRGGFGGNDAHIDSSRSDAAGAATHDINHFGGAQDGYAELSGTGDGRKVINKAGYTDEHIMGSNTSGDRLRVDDVSKILENDSTYKFQKIGL